MDKLVEIFIKICDLIIQFFSGDEWKKVVKIIKKSE